MNEEKKPVVTERPLDVLVRRLRTEVGNALDQWEMLANDIKTDPGMDNLNAAMRRLMKAAEALTPD